MIGNPYAAFDDYGLHHLARHLYDLRGDAARRRALYRLICVPYMREKQRRTFSHRAFVADVSLAIEAAAEEMPPNLAQQARGCLLTAALGAAVSAVPPALLGVLTGVDRVERALGLTVLIQDGRERCQAYLAIARALLGQGKAAQAVEVLDRALAATTGAWQEPSLDEYRNLEALAWSRGEDVDAFADVWGQYLEREWTRDDALVEIVQCLARAGALERAFEVVDRVDSSSARDKARATIAQTLVRQGDLDRAWTVMETIGAEWERSAVLVDVARLSIQRDAVDAALEVAEQIETDYQRDTALVDVVGALAAREEFDYALEVAEEIEDADRQAHAWIAVAEALLPAGETRFAREVVESVRRSSWDPWALSRLVPLLVQLRDRQGATDAAATAVQAMADVWGWEDKAEALQQIAVALAHLSTAAGPGVALDMIEELWDDREIICTLAWLAAALAEVGRHRRAVTLVREALERTQRVLRLDIRKLALSEIARAALRVMGPDRAIELVGTIQDPDERTSALSSLATALAEVGSPLMAAKLVDRLLLAAERVPRDRDRDEALMAMAVALAKMGQLEKARVVVEAIDRKWGRDRALEAILEAEGSAETQEDVASPPSPRRGDLEQARRAFVDMPTDIVCYNEYDMPASMAREARKNAVVRVARDLAQAGDWETALEAVEVLERAPYRAEALRAVAEGLAMGEWTGRAVEVARGIVDEGQRVAALRDVAQASGEAGDAEGALAVWQMALQEARWVGCAEVFQVLGSGASLLARLDEGRALWEAFKAVREIEGWLEES